MWILLHTERSQGSQTEQVRDRVALIFLSELFHQGKGASRQPGFIAQPLILFWLPSFSSFTLRSSNTPPKLHFSGAKTFINYNSLCFPSRLASLPCAQSDEKLGKRWEMTDAPERLTLGIHLMLTQKRGKKRFIKKFVGNSDCRRCHISASVTFSTWQPLSWSRRKILSCPEQPQGTPTNGSLLMLKDFFLGKGIFHPFVSFQKDSSDWL